MDHHSYSRWGNEMPERKDTTLRWLEVGANVGIICGLILVSFQITQERDIATEVFNADTFSVTTEQQRHISGEEVSSSLATAINRPADLTPKDFVVLDSYYAGEFARLIRQEEILGTTRIGVVGRWTHYLLGNPFGYAWWQSRPAVLDLAPLHRDAIEAVLNSRDRRTQVHIVRDRYATIREHITSLTDESEPSNHSN